MRREMTVPPSQAADASKPEPGQKVAQAVSTETPVQAYVHQLGENAKLNVRNHFVTLQGWRLWGYRLSALTLYGGLCVSMGFASAGGLSQFLPFDSTTGLLLFAVSVALWTALYGDSMLTYWRGLFTPGTLARDHAAQRSALKPYLNYLQKWAEAHPDWAPSSHGAAHEDADLVVSDDEGWRVHVARGDDDATSGSGMAEGAFIASSTADQRGAGELVLTLGDEEGAGLPDEPLSLEAFINDRKAKARNGLSAQQERRLRRWVDVFVGVPNAVFANATGTFFGLMGVFAVFAHGGALSLPMACFAALMGYFCGLFAAWTLTRKSIGDNSVRYLPTLWRGVRGLFQHVNSRVRRGYRRVSAATDSPTQNKVNRGGALKRGAIRGLTVLVAFGMAGFNFVAGYGFLSNLASVDAFTSHVPMLKQLGQAPALVNMGLAVVAGLLTVYAACTFFNFMLDQQINLNQPLWGQARGYLNKVAQSSVEQIKLLVVGTVTVLFTYMLVLDLGFAASSPLLQLTGSAVFAHAFALVSAPCICFLLGMMMKTGGDLLFRPWTEPQAVAELLALKVPTPDPLENALRKGHSLTAVHEQPLPAPFSLEGDAGEEQDVGDGREDSVVSGAGGAAVPSSSVGSQASTIL